MNLYFVRHAAASSKSAWEQDDGLRPLTRTGRQRFSAACEALIGAGVLRPDVILTSPFARACETAQILRDALPSRADVVQDDRLEPGFNLAALSGILAERADITSVAIVGHNPSFASVLSAVIGGAQVEMRKGAVALVEIEDPTAASGRLLWLAPPTLFDRESRG